MRTKRIKKEKYIYIAVAGVFLLALTLFLSTSGLLSNSSVPLGYKKGSIFSRTIYPIKEPKILEASISADGFSQKELSAPLPQDGSLYELHLTNTSESEIAVRMIRTPDGDWKDDPSLKIPAGEKIPFVLRQIGKYVIENAQNPAQTLTIQVK